MTSRRHPKHPRRRRCRQRARRPPRKRRDRRDDKRALGRRPRSRATPRSLALHEEASSAAATLVAALPRLNTAPSFSFTHACRKTRHLKRPIGVAAWETELVESCRRSSKGACQRLRQIEAELARRRRRRSPDHPGRRRSRDRQTDSRSAAPAGRRCRRSCRRGPR